MVKVAVAYNKDTGEIFEHFGHCEMFAVYEYGETIDDCRKVLIDCSDRHGHKAMADLMKEQDIMAVMSGNMGPEAKALLLSYGIVPVAGYCGDADTAADMLVTGQLPVIGEGAGSCGGGCGGCGGSCGGCGSEEGECDCGCGSGDGECGCGC
ncbi:MAG: hypothetical protein IJH53_10425 [Oscillospiraceae bacterium]|nr:hypothetical protein [Oscillospiraceae bacterium]